MTSQTNRTHNNFSINYQAIQNAKGKVDLYLEQELKNVEREKLNIEIKKYFKDVIKFNILEGHLKRDKNKKFRDFISNIKESD